MRCHLVQAHVERVFPHRECVTPYIQCNGQRPPRIQPSRCGVHSHLACTHDPVSLIHLASAAELSCSVGVCQAAPSPCVPLSRLSGGGSSILNPRELPRHPPLVQHGCSVELCQPHHPRQATQQSRVDEPERHAESAVPTGMPMPLQPRSPRPRMRCPSVSTTTLTSRSGQASSRCSTAPYITCASSVCLCQSVRLHGHRRASLSRLTGHSCEDSCILIEVDRLHELGCLFGTSACALRVRICRMM